MNYQQHCLRRLEVLLLSWSLLQKPSESTPFLKTLNIISAVLHHMIAEIRNELVCKGAVWHTAAQK